MPCPRFDLLEGRHARRTIHQPGQRQDRRHEEHQQKHQQQKPLAYPFS